MSVSNPTPWGQFSQDPRRTEAAPLRASDSDRDVVLQVLAEGYADGRLTREEYDDRAQTASSARTLGDLPPIINDLVPVAPYARPGSDLALASAGDLRAMAVEEYRRARRNAFTGIAVPAVVLTVIWYVAGAGFYWPVFVLAFMAANAVRLALGRQDFIDDHVRKLEKKQRKALEPPQPGDGA